MVSLLVGGRAGHGRLPRRWRCARGAPPRRICVVERVPLDGRHLVRVVALASGGGRMTSRTTRRGSTARRRPPRTVTINFVPPHGSTRHGRRHGLTWLLWRVVRW